MFDKKYIRFTKVRKVEVPCEVVATYINMALIEGFTEMLNSEISLTTLHVRNTEFSRNYHDVLVKESVDEIAKILGKALEEQNNWRR